jgi:biopolymer transport protein ExbB/TolQ
MIRKIFGILLLFLLYTALVPVKAPGPFCQEAETSAVVTEPRAEIEGSKSLGVENPAQKKEDATLRETWYQFFEKGRPISDLIAVVFLVGLLFAIDETRKISFDSLRSRRLWRMDLMRSKFDVIEKEVARHPNTHIGRLVGSLLTSYRTTGNLAGINQDISFFIQSLQDQFNSFRSRLDLLSDSAGALGLRGTVWGIFVTFEVENWTQDTVLRGMGLALVTTFIGIIVSLILNLLSTEVFNYFNRRNERLQLKVVEFRKNLYSYHSYIRDNGPGTE